LQLAGAEQHWFEGVSMEDKQRDAASAGVCAIRPPVSSTLPYGKATLMQQKANYKKQQLPLKLP
jgi:hypothetical protein